MANYQRVNGHWEIIPSSKEIETVNEDMVIKASNIFQNKLSTDKLKNFIKEDAPTDFMLKLFIPRYYNDGTKVSPDIIADIMAKISEVLGGTSTWAGKGYWIGDDILYEDKNIYTEILLRGMTPERASLLSKYIGSVIANTLEQEGALTILTPALSDFISKEDYEKNEAEALQNVKDLNTDEENYQ